jgi:hypothetical protein
LPDNRHVKWATEQNGPGGAGTTEVLPPSRCEGSDAVWIWVLDH